MTYINRKLLLFIAACAFIVIAQGGAASAVETSSNMHAVATNAPISQVFALPSGAKVLFKDDSGKTWRQNGVVTGAVQVVQAAFSNQLVNATFKCRHVIVLEEKTGRVLEEWRKGDQSLLLMLWPSEKGTTMFSWGISNE